MTWSRRCLIGLLAVTVALSVGCKFGARKEQKEEAPKETGQPGFLGAVKAIQEAGEAAQKMAERKPVDPVSFRDLLTVLPEAPAGWQKEGDPDARTVQLGDWKYSYAEQSFRAGEGKGHVVIKVTDGAYIPILYPAFAFAAGYSEESLDYYRKGITWKGHKGVEEFWTKEKRGHISMMVAERFIVEVQGHHIDNARVLHDWLNRIDTDKMVQWARAAQ
ncbi:MAG: hypothetical protein NZ742_01570 [Acidobacteria bacterium]|nr:hypothetical protein [Acidobacteriota bacterium]MDW7983540.1 hypothetical protein [Acidobacteriota bacterium]